MPETYAAVDIGSNTVHLLVAQTGKSQLKRLTNESEWLSLGEVVGKTGNIPVELVERIIQILDDYKKRAKINGAEGIYVFATEAIRLATNHDELIDSIQKKLGLHVNLITPQTEAEFSVAGISQDTTPQVPYYMIEIGGGSAQIALCGMNGIEEEWSLPLGTGMITAECGLEHPADSEMIKRIEHYVDQQLDRVNFPKGGIPAIGAGGVSRGLWRAVHPDGDRILHIVELEYLLWATQRLRIDKICSRFGVKSKRAGTLLPGAIGYLRILQRLQTDTMTISQFGVREGAILNMRDRKLEYTSL